MGGDLGHRLWIRGGVGVSHGEDIQIEDAHDIAAEAAGVGDVSTGHVETGRPSLTGGFWAGSGPAGGWHGYLPLVLH